MYKSELVIMINNQDNNNLQNTGVLCQLWIVQHSYTTSISQSYRKVCLHFTGLPSSCMMYSSVENNVQTAEAPMRHRSMTH